MCAGESIMGLVITSREPWLLYFPLRVAHQDATFVQNYGPQYLKYKSENG